MCGRKENRIQNSSCHTSAEKTCCCQREILLMTKEEKSEILNLELEALNQKISKIKSKLKELE